MIASYTEGAGWREAHLDDLVDQDAPICYGIVLPGPHHAGGVPVVKVKDIVRGSVRTLGLLQTSPEIDARYQRSRLKGDDILLSIRGTVGRVGIVPGALTDGNITQDTARIRIANRDTRNYVFQLLQSDYVQKQIRDHVVGQAVQGINIRDVRRLKFPFPRLVADQHFIAEILATQTTAIEKTEQLIASKSRQLGYLREHHLRPRPRFTRIRLRSVTRESTARNGTHLGRDAIMAVSKQVGMRPMRDKTIAASIERYKVVRPRAFAYNPMRLNIGSIAMSSFDNDVLVSPDYVVFECDETRLLPRYLNHLRHAHQWRNYFEAAGSGSVRVRIYYDDLATLVIHLPPLRIQEQVGALLDTAALEIEKLSRYIEALRQQKRGLTQKLLSGQWRVKAPKTRAA